MKPRLIVFLLLVACYSAGVLAIDGLVLPAAGINGFAQLSSSSFDFLGPEHDAQPPANHAGGHEHEALGADKMFSLWLRPFGVHRRGMNDVFWTVGSFSVLGTAAMMLLFLFPKRVRYVSQLLRAEPPGNHLLNILLGLSAYAIGYMLLRLSWLTIVGVPFIPFLVGGVWLATMLGILAVGFTLGRALFTRLGERVPVPAEALLGVWLLFVTGVLPYLGWIVGGLAAAMGFGAMLQTRFGSRERWSLAALEQPEVPLEEQGEERHPKILPLRRAR